MKFHGQLFRYALVGLTSNVLGYLLYLVFTNMWMGHKTAMTLVYVMGVSLTFVFNRNWTFGHRGHVTEALTRYLSIYAFGYLLNFGGLYIFVDKFGFSHQWVQGVLIIVIALLLFLLQKCFVFTGSAVDVNE